MATSIVNMEMIQNTSGYQMIHPADASACSVARSNRFIAVSELHQIEELPEPNPQKAGGKMVGTFKVAGMTKNLPNAHRISDSR